VSGQEGRLDGEADVGERRCDPPHRERIAGKTVQDEGAFGTACCGKRLGTCHDGSAHVEGFYLGRKTHPKERLWVISHPNHWRSARGIILLKAGGVAPLVGGAACPKN
jgi:hypothetical protein